MSAYDNDDILNSAPPLPPKLCQRAPPIPPKSHFDQSNNFFKKKQDEKIAKRAQKKNSISPKSRSIIVQNEVYRFVEHQVTDPESIQKDPDLLYENRKIMLPNSIVSDNENKPKSLLLKIKSLFKKKSLKKVKSKEYNDNEYFPSPKSTIENLPSRTNCLSEASDELCTCSDINHSRYTNRQNSDQFHHHVARRQQCHFSCVSVCHNHCCHCCQFECLSRCNPRINHNLPNLNTCVNCQPCICNTHFHSRAPSLGRCTSFSVHSRSVQSNHDRQSSGINRVESIDSIADCRLPVIVKPLLSSGQVSAPEIDSITMSLHENFQLLRKVGWYWGPLRSDEAEEIMTDRSDGTFIVRDSSHTDYLFSITFRVNNSTHHSRIQFSQNKFWLTQEGDGFNTVIDLIDTTIQESQNGKFRYFQNIDDLLLPTYAVILLYPLSRFRVMTSLKHIARFVIVSHVRNDHLDHLPLPGYLISYLQDKDHHYVENFYHYVNIMKVTDRYMSQT